MKPFLHHSLATHSPLLLLCSFLLISSFFPRATPQQTTTTTTAAAEAAAQHLLLSFKSSLPDHSSTTSLLQNWSPSTPLCSFSFLSCLPPSSSSSFSLSLSGLNLSVPFSSVSSFLLPLPGLLALSLSLSSLLSPFPFSPFPCSPSLSSLDLSSNSLPASLSDLDTILLSCSGLKSLNFSSNSVTVGTERLVSADASGSNSSTLQVLDLSNCRISGSGVMAWILGRVGCGEMAYLSLRGNAASEDSDLDFSGCGNLKVVDISNNNFSTPKLLFGESGCSSLERLDISSNRFDGDIGSWVSGCSQLKLLNLSTNRFSGLVPAFPAKALQFLYLDNNGFQGELPSHLADACTGLVELDLSQNNLSGSIPSGLGSCSVLESLDVSNNKLSGQLPSIFAKMTGMRKVNLGFNDFSGKLDDSWSAMNNLETLDLSSNNLSGSIPSGLCKSPRSSLKELFLQNNMFAGLIPPSLSNCSQLVSLDLSFNYLTGKIPSSLGSLLMLQDLMLLMNKLEGTIPEDLMFAQSLENLILDFNELTGGIPSGLQNCTSLNWVSLSNNRLSSEIPGWFGKLSNLAILKLSNNSFYGRIPPELGNSRSLIWLDLNTNNLNGSIPLELFKESGGIEVKINTDKRYAYIKNDGSKACHGAGNLLEFAGIRPEQLNRISTRNPCNFTRVYNGLLKPTFKNNGSMIFLDISHNMLSGSIPKEIGSMHYLFILNFGYNNLSGMIPPEIGGLHNLNILDLSNNVLEGSIPPALSGCSMLNEINLSGNLLSGPIPQMGQLGTFPASSFLNNTGLCGIPLARCGSDNSLTAESLRQKSNRRQAHIASSIAMGLLFTLLCIFSLVFIALESRKRKKKKKKSLDSARDIYIDSRSQSGTADTSWKLTSACEALSINLATFEKPLRKLTFADLLEATNGFHNDSLIGSGGFGDVYKAQLKDGNVVAIKKLIHVSGQGDREFTAEMETIGKIKHRNLVSLLGYCKVKEERLLVYEYMKYGSLEDAFHDRKNIGIKLKWAVRRKIAAGAARGLAFLHHSCVPHIIHRDMKSSNVLLDENLEARVSDFGMARLMSTMDTHLSVSTLAGTPGYVPPEYYQSFQCSTKGDVYSYGVVLLELLTGKRPTDSADFGDNNLVGWVKQHAKGRISDVFDPELMKEDPNLEIELLQHLKVACACLDDRPQKRPSMIQVLAKFKEIHAGYGLDSISSIVTDDGGLLAVEMSDLCIKEGQEVGDQ